MEALAPSASIESPIRQRPVVLLDGHNLAMRAYFAVPQTLRTSRGEPTNALFGVLRSLGLALDTFDPGYLAVVWDPDRGPGHPALWRRAVYAGYKQRPSTLEPRERLVLHEQLAVVRHVITTALGISQFEVPGFEADDLIARLAIVFVTAGAARVIIVSTDRDYFQLISRRVSVFEPFKGVAIGRDGLQALTGLTATQYLDRKILSGDAGDSVPPVKGLSGEKRYLKWAPALRVRSLAAILRASDWSETDGENEVRYRQLLPDTLRERFASRYAELIRNYRLVDLFYAADEVEGAGQLLTCPTRERLAFKPKEFLDTAIRYEMTTIANGYDRWVRVLERYHATA